MRILPALLSGLVLVLTTVAAFEQRNYDGTGNNLLRPLWGSAEITQIRALAGADYSDGVSGVSGEDRPSAREVTSEVFLVAPSVGAPQSALFVAWAQLVSFDLFLSSDNTSEPFEVPCNVNARRDADVWCPLGENSDPIPFFRSDAEVGSSSGVRNPINYATSYIDLDFVYGRSEEAAVALRTMEDGLMDISDDGTPFQNQDGTWKIADQRPSQFPVTFALHIVLLLEHNRCCAEVAPDLGYEGDEDLYQACRGWTIAVFQHIIKNDFSIRLVGMEVLDEYKTNGSVASSSYYGPSSSSSPSSPSSSSSSSPSHCDYDESINPGADVFATTVGAAALYAAIPPALRIVEPGYVSAKEDNIGLVEAVNDLGGLFQRNSVANILRGAALSSTLRNTAHFTSVVSNASPKFKIPVDAIQRGRDHGVPTYNDAREAYGLSRASSFDNVTSDIYIRKLLMDAYGGNISSLDALTGGLAEGNAKDNLAIFGDLLETAWRDQLYRALAGDRLLYNVHENPNEAVNGTTLQDLILRTVNVSDLSVSPFTIPEVSVCYENCTSESSLVALADEFRLGWNIKEDSMVYTISAKYIGEEGYMSIGFGGTEMATAQDYVVCEVTDGTTAICTDRKPVYSRKEPHYDSENYELDVEEVLIDGDWTSVTFVRCFMDLDDEDYDVPADIESETVTALIYAYREGLDVGQHSNSNRGAATVDFGSGTSVSVCEDDADFFLFHGALILIAWMVFTPVGIYYARYRKGDMVMMGNRWWEMHAELMAVATEMVLPLSITAIFSSSGTTSGAHSSEHAQWGFYMIAGIAAQVVTGWLRTQALQGKHNNFSTLHRINKHFHIWSGHAAFIAGAIQCYRGVELVSSQDSLVFSTFEIDYQIGSFGFVYKYIFPVWIAAICVACLFLETKKQIKRFHSKGAAVLLCFFRIKNADYVPDKKHRGCDGDDADERIIPRTEILPIYTMPEFNYKVLNGESWVIVDGAILDIVDFIHRHPGGARVLMNALGTDVTCELMGKDISVGNSMSYFPHQHTEEAWELVLSMVVGYIEDDEEDEADNEDETEQMLSEINKTKSDQSSIAQGSGEAKKASPDGIDREAEEKEDRSSVSSGRRASQGVIRAAEIARAWARKAFWSKAAGVVPSPPAEAVPPPTARVRSFERNAKSGKCVLQRFHVCPFVLRERMDGGVDRRPVYRYVFSCPESMVLAISGVSHFNMRIMRRDREVIVQRSYNAMAVRVMNAPPSASLGSTTFTGITLHSNTTDGTLNAQQAMSGDSTKSGTTKDNDDTTGINRSIGGTARTSFRGMFFKDALHSSKTPDSRRTIARVVPAEESNTGKLCVEMRIRLHEDGAMSKLLEQLANDPTNATVQLQGPFPVERLSPPLPHRNVVMIAGGTGINPMVQLVRDYQSLDRDGGVRASTAGSRLTVLWQAASAKELYCSDELESLEARSRGLLKWTALVNGDRQKTNDPAAPTAFFRRRSTKQTHQKSAKPSAQRRNSRHRPSNATHHRKPSYNGDQDGEEKIQRSFSLSSSIAPVSSPLSPSPSPRSMSYSAPIFSSPVRGFCKDSSARYDVPRGVFAFPATSKRSVGSNSTAVESEVGRRGRAGKAKRRFSSTKRRKYFVTPGVDDFGTRADSHVDRWLEEPAAATSPRSTFDNVWTKNASVIVSPGGGENTRGSPPLEPDDEMYRARSSFFRKASLKAFEPFAPGRQAEAKTVDADAMENTEKVRLWGKAEKAGLWSSRGKQMKSVSFGASGRNVSGEPIVGKVTKVTLSEAFGVRLMKVLGAFKKEKAAFSRGANVSFNRQAEVEALCGTGEQAGELQVVVCGPSGFVFHVEAMLDEIGVPSEAVVILLD